jgi:hypothetical protein
MAFRIIDPQRFADRCLPRFFKHNKLGSFQQQLLTYGFMRVPNESCLDISAIWQHPKFQAGRPDFLEQITRATGKRAAEDGQKPKQDDDDDDADAQTLNGMQEHLGRLTDSLNEMQAELKAVS